MTIRKEQIMQWFAHAATELDRQKAYLTELDAAIGDADHGTNIARGFGEIVAQLPSVADKDLGTILKTISMTLMSKVGGASGMLYGNFFLRASMAMKDKEELTPEELRALLETGVGGIVQRGRAELGDKTMIDAWSPALNALKSSLDAGDDLDVAMQKCVVAAEQGMKDTIPLQAKKGRASYLGERSIGHQDPGATSTHIILQALLAAIS